MSHLDLTAEPTSPSCLAAVVEPRERFAGRYRIEALLGVGATGAVYRAYDELLRGRVALKLLVGSAGPDDCRVARLRREVQLARRVTHVNTVRTHELGRADDRWFLTMELIEGETLHELLRREGRLEPNRACRIAADVCAGLAAIHAAGVIHRDLKPANVLLDRRGRVAIADFGIARSSLGDDTPLTAGVIGTPGYMAPEQAMIGEQVDARADLFALGVMLFALLGGEHPGCVVARAHERGEPIAWPPRLDACVDGIPAELAALVSRCLAREPSRRPTSAAAIEQTLRMLAEPRPRATAEPERSPAFTKVELLGRARAGLRVRRASLGAAASPWLI